jgi:YidC/Oxa1 family membrane protein insertase
MEGQGKRLLVAVGLALGVMLLWNMIFPSEKPKDDPAAVVGSGSGSTAVAASAAVAKSGVCYAKPEAGVSEAPRGKEERVTLDFPGKLRATFSTYDGSLVSWHLADERFAKDHTKGELLPSQPDAGAFQVGFWRDSTRCLPEKTEWKLASKSATQVVFTYEHAGITLEKTFTVVPDAYIVKMALKMNVKAGDKEVVSQKLAITSYAFQDPKADAGGGMQVQPRVWVSSTLKEGEILHTPLKDLKDGETGIAKPRYEPTMTWTGFEHPYLLVAYAPKPHAPTELIAKHTYPLEPYGLLRTDIEFGATAFKAGAEQFDQEVVAYLGPKYYNQLDHADEAAGFATGFKKTIDLGWFAFIGRPLMWLLFQFQSVLVNWGVAIIFLTFLVKGLTLFWTTKSMRSMKQMAALAPQMKALQEKYKDDKQRIQAETMALYKQHNVNPIAGCLPIVLQMPIWIALYRMLSSAGELYQQPFIPGWIDDLTNTDPLHILPIVLVITMFVQARLTPQTGDSRQQKFLQYGMPLMFGVMSFFFPAGLTLYIFTNTCLSALHSIYMNKYDKKSLAIAAQMRKNQEAAAAAAAKPASNAGAKPAKADKPVKKPAATPAIIDVSATETTDDADDAGTDDAGPAASDGAAGKARPRRKKRRR